MIASHAEAHRSVNTRIPSIVSVRIEVPGAISEYAYLLYAVTSPVAYDGNITSHAEANHGVNTGIPHHVLIRVHIPGAVSEYANLCRNCRRRCSVGAGLRCCRSCTT